MGAKECIANGKSVLGIEFGSTRIKAVLVDENNKPIASGAHDNFDNKSLILSYKNVLFVTYNTA